MDDNDDVRRFALLRQDDDDDDPPANIVKLSKLPAKGAPLLPESDWASAFWRWNDFSPTEIEPRKWVYGRHYLIGALSATIADGGIGKSTLGLTEAIAMVTGRPLLGITPSIFDKFEDGVRDRYRVVYYNAEESLTEIKRRVAAICKHFKIDPGELNYPGSSNPWRPEVSLTILSGHDCPLVFGAPGPKGGVAFNDEAMEFLESTEDDVIILDPFVSLHQCPENDNVLIDAIVKRLARAASNKAIEIVHHARKPGQGGSVEIGAADARGASALTAGVRSLRILNRMTEREAARAKVDDPRNYFRIDKGKANYAAISSDTLWCRHQSVILPNGDDVGVVVPWHFPGALDGITADHVHQVQELARDGQYRADPRSPDWIGTVVAEVLDLDLDDEADKQRVKAVLKAWFKSGVLCRVEKQRGEGDRHMVLFVAPTLHKQPKTSNPRKIKKPR